MIMLLVEKKSSLEHTILVSPAGINALSRAMYAFFSKPTTIPGQSCRYH